MTWTALSDLSTGTLITGAVWNSLLGATGNLAEVATVKRCRVTTTGASIANNIDTVVAWDGTETYDPAGWHSTVTNPSRITVDASGVYLVRAQLGYDAQATNTRGCYLRTNGTVTVAAVQQAISTAATPTIVPAMDVIEAAAGDYFEVVAFQSSGSALGVSAITVYSCFVVVRLGIL